MGREYWGRALWKAPLPGAWDNEFYFQESHPSSPLTPDGISPTPPPPRECKGRLKTCCQRKGTLQKEEVEALRPVGGRGVK